MKKWFHKTTKTRRAVQPSDLVHFKRLPAHVNVRDTIATHPVTPARDPYAGRDTERDFVIRYGARSTNELAVMNRMSEGQAILVAVDGGAHGWDALEWAAAEAASTEQALHIVHVAEWPPVIDPWTQLPGEQFAAISVTAEHIIAEAIQRAYAAAPELLVATEVVRDAMPGQAILRAAHDASLIVLGRRRDGRALRSRFRSSVGSYVARRASTPVVIVGLADRAAGPSAGRIAVLVDGHTDALDALALAFRAAQRRGIGVTVLHTSPTRDAAAEFDTAALIFAFRDAFETVDVIEEYLPAPVGPTLPAMSEGAALLVVGARPSRHLHRAQITPVSRHVVEVSRTPVVIVPTITAA